MFQVGCARGVYDNMLLQRKVILRTQCPPFTEHTWKSLN